MSLHPCNQLSYLSYRLFSLSCERHLVKSKFFMPLLLEGVLYSSTGLVYSCLKSVLGKQQVCFKDKTAVVKHAWIFHKTDMCSIAHSHEQLLCDSATEKQY